MLEGNVDPNQLSRLQLLELAQSLRVSDADVMTRAELRAAIDKARRPEPKPAAEPVTWVSVARRLIASIVEQGLNLPDAAALIRGDTKLSTPPKAPPPVATVTLARIYAAQGHLERAIKTLDEVLTSDPDHDLARQLRQQLLTRLDERRAQAASAPSAGASPESAFGADAEEKDDVLPPAPGLVDDERAEGIGAAAAEADAGVEADADAAAAAVTAAAAAVVEAAVAAMVALSSPPAAEASGDEAGVDEELAPDTSATPHLPPSTPVPASGSDSAPVSEAVASGIVPQSAVPESAAPESAAVSGPAPSTNGEARAARVANDASPPPFSSSPQLIVIETNTPTAYLYWELGISPGAASAADPHWISVVVHSPDGAGSRRQQRSFPVSRATGALRLLGLPPAAVVRAKLTRESTATARPLAIASNVRSEEPPTRTRLDPGFNPLAQPSARGLANHAIDHLARASAAYW